MATKQTRRSISVRGATYDTLRRYCEQHQRSMSDLVEEQLATLFTKAPARDKPGKPARSRTVANRVLRAPAKVVEVVQAAQGRPAPTPFEAVVPERFRAPRGDYRMIRF